MDARATKISRGSWRDKDYAAPQVPGVSAARRDEENGDAL